jgi:hypothetical protein
MTTKSKPPGAELTNLERARALLFDCVNALTCTPALHEDSIIQEVCERLNFIRDHLINED